MRAAVFPLITIVTLSILSCRQAEHGSSGNGPNIDRDYVERQVDKLVDLNDRKSAVDFLSALCDSSPSDLDLRWMLRDQQFLYNMEVTNGFLYTRGEDVAATLNNWKILLARATDNCRRIASLSLGSTRGSEGGDYFPIGTDTVLSWMQADSSDVSVINPSMFTEADNARRIILRRCREHLALLQDRIKAKTHAERIRRAIEGTGN
jgi:hypothetical protein